MIYDVLVIGSGIAGLSAAIKAKELGSKVAIIAKTNPLRSNSSMAAGGINAALGFAEADAVDLHKKDTLKGGLSKKLNVKSFYRRKAFGRRGFKYQTAIF